MSIIKELGGLVTGQLMKQVANSLGESESGIGKVIGALAPTILGGILNKSTDSGAFGQIFDMLGNKDNAGFLDNLGGLVGGGNIAQGDPRDVAGSLMGSLFGDKVGGIIDMVSSIAGVNKSTSSSLMGMVGPMVMGYLGKKILKGGLNASGLAGLLNGERNNIADAMPNQLADLIGFAMPDSSATDKVAAAAAAVTGTAANVAGGASKVVGNTANVLGNSAKAAAGGASKIVGNTANAAGNVAGAAAGAAGAAAGAVGDTAKAGGNALLKYLLPILLLGGAFFAWKSCGGEAPDLGTAGLDKVGDLASSAGDVATKGMDAVGDVAAGAADVAGDAVASVGGLLSKALPGGVTLDISDDGTESNLLQFIRGDAAVDNTSWFNFDGLNFATGSSNLDMGKSQAQLANIAAILKAYPNVNIKIGGYTDNTGSADGNMRLSNNRASKVSAALTAMGIDASRLAAEGFGIANPVATNDTEEGRAQNRRIAVRVTKK